MKAILLIVLGMGCMFGSRAQWNYDSARGQSLNAGYTDLGTNGTAITTNYTGTAMTHDDDNSSVQNIGFTFSFNGKTFTQFVLNTNGFIKLGVDTPSSRKIFYPTIGANGVGSTGPAAGVVYVADSNLIYPFSHDLNNDATGLAEYRVYTSGTTGSRVCTIQYKHVMDKLTPTQYTYMEFQVKLYETTNTIDFVYGTFTASSNTSTLTTAAVGIKGNAPDSSVNVAKGSSTLWNATLSTANNLYFKNKNYSTAGPNFSSRNAVLPDAGRTFRFVSNSTALPVTLVNFSATENNHQVAIHWTTTNEINEKNFEVQRSANATDFTTIGVVAAKDDAATNHYLYTDANLAGTGNVVFYRLQQNDENGRSSFSNTIRISLDGVNDALTVSAMNPFHDAITLQLQTPAAGKAQVSLLYADGRVVTSKELSVPAGSSVVILEEQAHLAKGVYFLRVAKDNAVKTIRLLEE
ncbi:hypothetical protein F5148DRAFT_1286203 [Russula earlei]|uniref:Uncharacterized protein n=1 Tax=Russula earlei TaxID=71964 RepID=A0ACC0U4Q9_9AGAM|nr:hypothetical protein F5148DRAFT_1286203 [Russula earlei]